MDTTNDSPAIAFSRRLHAILDTRCVPAGNAVRSAHVAQLAGVSGRVAYTWLAAVAQPDAERMARLALGLDVTGEFLAGTAEANHYRAGSA